MHTVKSYSCLNPVKTTSDTVTLHMCQVIIYLHEQSSVSILFGLLSFLSLKLIHK